VTAELLACRVVVARGHDHLQELLPLADVLGRDRVELLVHGEDAAVGGQGIGLVGEVKRGGQAVGRRRPARVGVLDDGGAGAAGRHGVEVPDQFQGGRRVEDVVVAQGLAVEDAR
jgi:hypothetical protein